MAMKNRTKTGCISCRIRRIKCDETKPHCIRCTSSRRVCDGYLPEDVNMSRRQLTDAVRNLPVVGPLAEALTRQSKSPSPPNLSPFSSSPIKRPASPSDAVYFDYFRRSTAPNTDSFVPSNFWGQDLLQLAHAEPAMWHATLALGALHRRWELKMPGEEMDGLIRRATSHYAKAMSLASQLDSPAKVLALSLPLIGAANMLGFWGETHTHILAGFRLLQDAPDTSDTRRIGATLTRLDLQSLTFSDSCYPYPYEEVAAVRSPDQGMVDETEPFLTYSHAASTLFALMRKLMLNDVTFFNGVIDEQTYHTQHAELLRRTEVFEMKIADFESRRDLQQDESAAISIRIYHAWLRLIFRATLFGLQMRFDQYTGYFQRIILLTHIFMKRQKANPTSTSSLTLSLEPAVVVPLFDTLKRCRHPVLRRHGLKLLREMDRHEGMWRSDGAASAADAVVAMEEGAERGAEYDRLASRWEAYCERDDLQEAALAVPWASWSLPGYAPPTNYTWDGIEPIPEAGRIMELLVVARFQMRELDLTMMMGTEELDTQQPYSAVHVVTVKF